MDMTFLCIRYIPEKTRLSMTLRFNTVVPWTLVPKSIVVIFDIDIGFRIIRLTMLKHRKNYQFSDIVILITFFLLNRAYVA